CINFNLSDLKILKDKVVIITGASSGIGRACAEAFATKGANIVLAARQYVSLCALGLDLEKRFGVKVLAVQCDVSREEDCEQLIKQTLVAFKAIDILVNNA